MTRDQINGTGEYKAFEINKLGGCYISSVDYSRLESSSRRGHYSKG
jgi:hypothetical protein